MMMTDPRSLPDPRMGIPADPRVVITADPRTQIDPRSPVDPRAVIADARGLLSVCTCGLPNCPRVPHHPGSHAMTLLPEGHLATAHGLAGLPLGAAPVGHVDPALLYQMGAAYGIGDSPDAMRSLPQLNGYYPYDPTAAYPYLNGYAGIDARRKNATKESTNTLKAWLYEHRKNPYPTKGEKIMLAILTKMTLTQVSTWFANARRRLKKENKVTWVTKDDDMDDDDDDVNSDHNSDVTDQANTSGNSAGDENNRHHGSIGDDDDNISVISGGDRSDIDVEENSDYGEDEARVPPMMPHALPHFYLSNHRQTSLGQFNTSFMQCNTSPRTDQSETSDSGVRSDNKRCNDETSNPSNTSRLLPDTKPSNNISPITPPPSPRDAKHSQSESSSHTLSTHIHQTKATIHHHPVTSPRISSLQAPSSSPTKAKIWSIADVVSSNENNKTDSKPTITSSHPHAQSHMNGIGASSPIVSLGGAPVRPGGMPQGVVVPGAEGPYSLAYYPYGLPHPAAAAMMASQVTSHLRIPHPYANSAHALSGHPLMNHPVTSTSGREHPMLGHPGFGQPRVHLLPSQQRPADLHRSDETRRPDSNNKQNSPRLIDPKCPSTAFTPVTQRPL